MGEFLFRHRLALIVGFFGAAAATAVGLARLDGASEFLTPLGRAAFPVTGALCLVAFALRASGEARLGTVVYGQAASPRLVTSGPFRFMRHPLYAGTWLFFVAGGAPWLPLAILVPGALVFGVSLWLVAAHEERMLEAVHGDAWQRYAAAVPRFIGFPHAAEPDGLRVGARAWMFGSLSNLGFLSLGVYRLLLAAGLDFRGLGTLNLLCLMLWIVVVFARRVRAH